MSKEKLINTRVRSENAKRLQQLLLDYHQHRQTSRAHPLRDKVLELGAWQTARLKQTHNDLYHHPRYHQALDFLLEDLYAPKDFSKRDTDIERVFPVMVKLLPDHALYTAASLVELNLLSQRLDIALAEMLYQRMGVREITEQNYAQAYQLCDNRDARLHQIQLVANVGDDLERYVHSRMLSMALKMTEKPAHMAGLGELHQFLTRGFSAFRTMGKVDSLLGTIIARETLILELIFTGAPAPFGQTGPSVPEPLAQTAAG